MEDENEECQEGPFAVWQMFNAPTMVLFNNLESAEDGLDRLLTSILKLSGDFSEVLASRPGSGKFPDAYYCSFNAWLLGRLFYLWSARELERVHIPSKDAQLKVLNILCINSASFYQKLHTEYFSILGKLVKYYQDSTSDNKPVELLLENFIPELAEIPNSNVQLNFEPIFVKVQDLKTCETLLCLTLQLLSESMPMNDVYIDKNMVESKKLFKHVLFILENCSTDLKMASMKYFSDFIYNSDTVAVVNFSQSFPNTFRELLFCTEALFKSMSVLFETGEVNAFMLDNFCKAAINILKIAQENMTNEIKHILQTIGTVILGAKNKIFSKALRLFCLAMSNTLELPKECIRIQNMDSSEIETLNECYCENILAAVNDGRDNNVDISNNWYYSQVVESFKFCGDVKDFSLCCHHLEKTAAALKILSNISFRMKKDMSKDTRQVNGHNEINGNEQECDDCKHLLKKDLIVKIWDDLSDIIKQHNVLNNNYWGNSDTVGVNLIMETVLSTMTLCPDLTKGDTDLILQIICLQNTPIIVENSVNNFHDIVKATVLRYLLMGKILLKTVPDLWNKISSCLANSLIKEKSCDGFQIILSSTPLLLLNKLCSASKLIGEILMSAFMSKNAELQKELLHILPAITCIALGTYNVILKTTEDNFGHDIFRNNLSATSVVCTQCHIGESKTTEEFLSKLHKEYSTLKQHSNTVLTVSESTTNSLKTLLTKFLNKSQYVNIDERDYWRVLGRMCNHYFVFDYGVSSDVATIGNCIHVINALKSCIDSTTDQHIQAKAKKQQAFNLCVNLLVKSTRHSLENCDYSQSAATLHNIKAFGELKKADVVLAATKLLVYFIVHPQCPHSPLATVYLREICEHHGYTPNQVYHRYKNDYCKLFVECTLYSGKEFAIALLKVVRAFGFVGYRDFISKDVHHFLPYLIPYSVTVKEVPSMIEQVASLVQCSVANFLIERFPHIYVHVYMNEDKEVANKCYSIIETLTRKTILNLIKKHFRVILTEFLLQYCHDPEKVLNACRYLACHDPDVSTPSGSMSMSTSQIADFLNPKFLGILAYFDHKLVNTKVALSVKRKALTSFPDIMQLMGVKYLTPLRFKVLATLRSALPLTNEFPNIVALSWGAFIHNIDSMSLGPLLPNLAVSLLQQFEYASQEINSIFQFLVLNNENLLSSHISELFFLADTKISEKIKMVIKKHVKRTQPDGFLDKIKWYLQHLDQEIPIIKACAYAQLDRLLKTNRNEIHKAIFAGKTIDPVIVELIDYLLIGCKDTDQQVSLASGACLGQLGAIEAGHLPRQYVQPDRSPFAFSIGDNCFAATALVELARAFQYEKDTKNMDCYALTIQEILKIYDISPTGSKKEVWFSFPEHLHQIMSPLLSSRYTLAYPSQPKKAHPLFGSAYATTFLEWAHNWAGQLIPLIDSESVRELLRTVHPSMRRDVRTLFLFLPYVLLHAVMARNSNQFIQDEILAVISLESIEQENTMAADRTKYKMLRHVRMIPTINTVQLEEGNQSKCRKTIYTLFDFLNRWLLEWCHSKQRPTDNDNYKALASFMEKFDKLMIARGNFACGELERALQYLELYMEEEKNSMQEQLPLLAEIYALLDEPDNVAGILSIKRSEPSLKELILAQVVTGRLQDAALCYERLAQERQLDKHSLQGMIECYLGLDQPFTAYRLLSEHESSDSVAELAAEPLWRLGRFEQLDELVNKPVVRADLDAIHDNNNDVSGRENWGLIMGRILLSYRSQDVEVFTTSYKDAISRLLTQMDGETKGESALRSGYQSVLGLHIVAEARHAMAFLRSLKSLPDGDKRGADLMIQQFEEWRRRLAVVQSDVRTIEPLLRLRRILLQQTKELLEPSHPLTANKLKSSIGELWLQSAKHARKARIFQQSYMYILNAEEYHPEELFIEKSKMYWARCQNEHAFTTLRRGLEDSYPQMDLLTEEQRKICAKAKLLIAKYNDETTNVGVDVNIGYYKEAVEAFKQWEKSWVCLGAYYEKVTENSENTDLMWSRRLHAMNSYGKALQYGHKYLYQSMPRMLSIWLGVEVTSNDVKVHIILAQMTEVIKTYSERLPLYLYLTAFSQIVSRICHPVKEVYQQLKAIIVKLILAYPQHTLWMMMCVIKSSYPQRIKRCSEVFADPRLKEPRMLKLVCDFTQLAEKLIELCNKPITGCGQTTTVASLVRTLPRLLSDENFSRIMMPFQEFCKVVLPSKAAAQDRIEYSMPAEPPVYIVGIEDLITILPSLQKPRKVTLRGSNGISYIILLKPRDDLRKDYRLMEFNGVVNRFLQDAPETRRRRLYIRTYSVLPLNEECGLIEWVPNLVGLRPILLHIYKQKGIHTSNRELKEMMCLNKDSVERKKRVYEELLLPRHPPVFQEWFRRVFSDPYGWYQARSAYIRTTAVMSMVGYILGLGDRHGENVSFDSTNGDTVHVDFNCLFNKGEAFECPERVPFRLTHNMEAAMGPLKHEGMFRKSCEAVMRALREQTAALMSVIGPFVYDPLVAWGRGRPVDSGGERTNEQALQHLEHIRQRLNGMVRTKNKTLSLSLSAEGQVEHLIVEATSINNLCQMYIGWGPFL